MLSHFRHGHKYHHSGVNSEVMTASLSAASICRIEEQSDAVVAGLAKGCGDRCLF
jgi:hypothetical protein